MTRLLTQDEHDGLLDIVEDPAVRWVEMQAWSQSKYGDLDHAETALKDKLVNHAADYAARVAAGNYRNRVERDQDEAAAEAAFQAAKELVKPVEQKRSEGYVAAGVTIENMMVALWERDVEGQPGAAQKVTDMETARQVVKTAHPKP
jgi:hypothetical protein